MDASRPQTRRCRCVLTVLLLVCTAGTARPDDFVGRILFTGDTMLARYIGEEIVRQDDPSYPYDRIADYLSRFDTVITNLEVPVSRRGTDQGERYPFRADPVVLSGLRGAGVSIVSLANNHIFDFGAVAALDTLAYLEEHGIDAVGAGETVKEATAPVIRRYGDIRVSFLAFTNLFAAYSPRRGESFSIAPAERAVMAAAIAAAETRSEIVTVQLHWGYEYETEPRISQRELAAFLHDAGADIIVGHHPHVVQDVVYSPEGVTAFSLGNFIFDQNFSEDTSWGLVLDVAIHSDGAFTVTPQPIFFGRGYQPYISNTKRTPRPISVTGAASSGSSSVSGER